MALVTEFLTTIRRFVLDQNGDCLRDWLQIENDVAADYYQLGQELRSAFPANGSDALEKFVDKCLPEEDDVPPGKGSPWPGFNSLMKSYLEYWRDVDFDNLVALHTSLSDLLISCANALANPTYGVMLLQTSMSFSESLSKLVMGITRQPDLMAQIQGGTTGDESGEKKSIVELAADVIQKIFTSCLTDRSSTRWSPPKGKKVAVYMFANLTLKLLFACDKSRLAIQMFTNLSASGPALALYPASQRVTFLYYLGRFHFDYSHFHRAHKCFEAAYQQCPPQFVKHRRLILTYWIPSNLLLGRFPSLALLQRPEAGGFGDIFIPICTAIRAGNFAAFHAAMALSRDWLWEKGLYLTLLYRLKPLIWRSFTRRVFLLTWQSDNAGDTRKVASLSLDHLVTAATYVQKLLEGYVPIRQPGPKARPPPINAIFLKAVANSVAEVDSHSLLAAPAGGPRRLMPSEGLIFGNKRPDLENMEAVVAGLVYAGLLNGFVARQQKLFAIEGAKRTGGNPLLAGWPTAHRAIMERLRQEYEESVAAWRNGDSADPPGEFDDVPGWVVQR